MNIHYDTFISGEVVDLVVLTSEIVDKTDWYNWFNDEENNINSQNHRFPNSKEKQMEFFKTEIENSTTKLQLGILHKSDKVLIGTISLKNIDYLNGKCELSGVIGEKKYQTLKPYMEASDLIIRHAFEQLNMNRVYSGTLSIDIMKMFIRILGFEREGTLKQDVYKNGQYLDVYLYALTKDKYYSD
jgi:[ribosomal protein S5]-alanine N-acetyltransferase